MAQSLIKKSFYLEAMPTEHLSELSNEQKRRIENLIRQNKKLEFSEITALLMEAAKDYSQTMNNIIFDTHVEKSPGELIPHAIIQPSKSNHPSVPYYGMLELESNKGAKEVYMWSPYEIFRVEPKSFTDLFKEFLLNSVFITPESVYCIQSIKGKVAIDLI